MPSSSSLSRREHRHAKVVKRSSVKRSKRRAPPSDEDSLSSEDRRPVRTLAKRPVRAPRRRQSRKRAPSSDDGLDEEEDEDDVASSSSGASSDGSGSASGSASSDEEPEKQYKVVLNRKSKRGGSEKPSRSKDKKRHEKDNKKPSKSAEGPEADAKPAAPVDEAVTVQASEVLAATGLDAKPAPGRGRTLEHRGGGSGDYGAAYNELYEQLCSRMVHRITQIIYHMHAQAKTEKRFKYQLAEIQRWNQNQINRITRLFVRNHKDIIRVFRFAYAADVLVMSVVVQRDENSADVEIECPRFSDFVHRCFVEAARNLFDHADILNPGLTAAEKFQVRDAMHVAVKRAIATALRMMVPIHKIAPVRPEDEEQYDAIEEGAAGGDIGLGGTPWADDDSEAGGPDSDDDDIPGSADEEDDDDEDDDARKPKKPAAKSSKKAAVKEEEEEDDDDDDSEDDDDDSEGDDDDDEDDDGSSDDEDDDSQSSGTGSYSSEERPALRRRR